MWTIFMSLDQLRRRMSAGKTLFVEGGCIALWSRALALQKSVEHEHVNPIVLNPDGFAIYYDQIGKQTLSPSDFWTSVPVTIYAPA